MVAAVIGRIERIRLSQSECDGKSLCSPAPTGEWFSERRCVMGERVCENCGQLFEVKGDSTPLYCGGCQDWFEWKLEEAAQQPKES